MDDDLLSEFLTESAEYLEGVETQLVQFERDPTDASLVSSIFRLVHTIKGTSSFLGLNRLQSVAHAAETLIGDLRDGVPPTQKTVSLILAAIDRIKSIMSAIEGLGAEAEGDDSELIAELEANVASNMSSAPEAPPAATPPAAAEPAPVPDTDTPPNAAPAAEAKQPEPPAAPTPAKAKAEAEKEQGSKKPAERAAPAQQSGGGKGGETIRVAVDTIERIMQLVSELVLNRNQLLEITRNRENDEIKPPCKGCRG